MGAVCCPCCDDNVVQTSDYYQPTAPARAAKYASSDRYQNINVSANNPYRLIDGYQKEPLLPLADALQPLDGRIPGLSERIQEALAYCRHPSPDKLTRDESAAIYLYSMKWDPSSLADQLHTAWASEDRSQLVPWFRYLRLFKSAFDKLPNAPTRVYQGGPNTTGMKQKFEPDGVPLYCSFGACLDSGEALKQHLAQQGHANPLIVSYEDFECKSISGYTQTPHGAKESIMFPSLKAGAVTVEERFTDGSVMLHFVAKNKLPTVTVPASVTSRAAVPAPLVASARAPVPVVVPAPVHAPTPIRRVNPSTIEYHFMCVNKLCKHRCLGNHHNQHSGRCVGYSPMKHICEHRCIAADRCFKCGKHVRDLLECNQCRCRYCEQCCFKPVTLHELFNASEAAKSFRFKNGQH